VDQVEVDVVELQAVERPLEGLLGAVITGIGQPQLGGDEDVVPRYAAALDGPADDFFAAV
jgi:hypothetical protein